MALKVRMVDGVTIITPHGMLLGGKETDELQRKIVELNDAGNQKLLINLGDINHMSSMGLATLFLARAKYVKRNARVKLCSVGERIRQIFVLVQLPLVFGDDVHETEEEALASFRAAGSPTHG